MAVSGPQSPLPDGRPPRAWPWMGRFAPFLAALVVVLAGTLPAVVATADTGSAAELLGIFGFAIGLAATLAVALETAPDLPILDTVWYVALSSLFIITAAVIGGAAEGGRVPLPGIVVAALLVGLVVRWRVGRVRRRG